MYLCKNIAKFILLFTVLPLAVSYALSGPNGNYGYTLTEPYTSANGAAPATDLGVETFSYTATDANGNTVQGSITIDVIDDIPTANADTDSFGNAAVNTSITGNVIDGNGTNEGLGGSGKDVFGADGPAAGGGVALFEHSGGSGSSTGQSGVAGGTISGNFGTLKLNADGSYTYTRTSTSAGNDEFTYTITDCDGDTATTTLTITLDSSAQPTTTSPSVVVDEDNLTAPPAPFAGVGNTTSPDDAVLYDDDALAAGGIL